MKYQLYKRNRNMKMVALIWATAIIVGVLSIAYMSAQINNMIQDNKPLSSTQASPLVPVHADTVTTPDEYKAVTEPLVVSDDGYNSPTDVVQPASDATPLESTETSPETTPTLPPRHQTNYTSANSDFNYAAQ